MPTELLITFWSEGWLPFLLYCCYGCTISPTNRIWGARTCCFGRSETLTAPQVCWCLMACLPCGGTATRPCLRRRKRLVKKKKKKISQTKVGAPKTHKLSVWARGLGSTTLFQFYNTAVQSCWPWDFTAGYYGQHIKLKRSSLFQTCQELNFPMKKKKVVDKDFFYF